MLSLVIAVAHFLLLLTTLLSVIAANLCDFAVIFAAASYVKIHSDGKWLLLCLQPGDIDVLCFEPGSNGAASCRSSD